MSYKTDFITEALIRLDFGVPIEGLKYSIEPELSKIILEEFKIYEPEELKGKEVKFDSNGAVDVINKEERNFRYFGRNKEKFINVNHSFLVISYKKYENFEKMRDELIKILEKMISLYKELQIRRIGIRYINQIDIQEKETTDWGNYINSDLISMLHFSDNPKEISRAMSNLEYNYGEYNLKFQYGMFNPDYPAVVKRKQFILDFDSYYDGYIDNILETKEFLEKAHEKIVILFENSIKEDLRSMMRSE